MHNTEANKDTTPNTKWIEKYFHHRGARPSQNEAEEKAVLGNCSLGPFQVEGLFLKRIDEEMHNAKCRRN